MCVNVHHIDLHNGHLEVAAYWLICPHNRSRRVVTLDKIVHLDSTVKWKIAEASYTFNKNGKWEHEPPIPSTRTDEYLQNNRYDSIDEALEVWGNFKGNKGYGHCER